ncbi:MAG: glucuronate isomerase [Chloroflexi bacterium CFX4]|nr:glucuronate isomerase [Chloroflexi bacterium CFX4]MDL1921078.1 glucuronate isomerase [Chloroflexi bacterium CFX3]
MPLNPDRFFSPEPSQRQMARQLYTAVADLPLVCPHGHVEPRLFADPDYRFESPLALIVLPDHYLLRMLHSQGVPLESLGVPTLDGTPYETDPRAAWRRFAAHFHLFRGTPSGLWLAYIFEQLFGIAEKLSAETADVFYDQIAVRLAEPDFQPRRLYVRFQIEVLCTTDAATDSLAQHAAIRDSAWQARLLPTFRPDGVINLDAADWRANLDQLAALTNLHIHNYRTFLQALEARRAFFRSMGAVATDHGAERPYTERLSPEAANFILQRALRGTANAEDARRFTAHMLIESARMSVEDGMVMQLHVGSLRDHNPRLLRRFGRDKGADIPQQAEFTRSLKPLLDAFGDDPRLTLIIFTLDESTYARDLAPLAGHYPSLRLGAPWWFHDSLNGMARYFDQVMETCGIYNTAGFNDDTRAFLSIPARHDLWRRAACNWLAGLVVRGILDDSDAASMAVELAVGLARRTYKL